MYKEGPDYIIEIDNNYNVLEKNIIYLKKLLKEQETARFDEIKHEVFG